MAFGSGRREGPHPYPAAARLPTPWLPALSGRRERGFVFLSSPQFPLRAERPRERGRG